MGTVTPRRQGIRRAAQALGLGLVSALLLVGGIAGLAGPAGADVTSPPGPNTPPSPPGWIAFQLTSTNLTVGSTVQIQVAGGSTVGAAQFFQGPDWPSTWTTPNGLTLQYNGTTPCTITSNTSCGYTVSGNPGPYDNVLFATPGIPQDQVPSLEQTVSLTSNTTTTSTLALPQPDPNILDPPTGPLTSPGFIFKAPGTSGITYTWTLLLNNNQIDQQTGTNYTPPASIFSTPGEYTVRLTASNGVASNSTSTSFEIPSSPAPQQPAPPTPGPAPASPPALSGLATSTVAYVPLTNFDVPTPAAIRPVTVIWLWRPDWFQTAEAARTAGRPTSVKRASVSVNAKGTAGPSAAPWLAGLATFGIFGFAWVLVRRRRVRTSILD